jgi:tetratricopeptide (TPR) repeat protein
VAFALSLIASGVLLYHIFTDNAPVSVVGPAPGQEKAGERPEPSAAPHAEEAPEARGLAEEVPSPPAGAGVGDEAAGKGQDTERIIGKGIEAFNAGDYRAALGHFIEASDSDQRGITGAGLTYYKLGDYRRAIEYLERSLSKGGDEFLSRKFLAFSYYNAEELEKSISSADKALSIKSDPELEGLREKLGRELRTQASRVEEQTLHFKVVFDGYAHSGVSRTVLGILEDAYRFIGQKMDYFPMEPVTVVLYTEKDFFDITELPAWAAGAYDGKIRLPVKGLEKQRSESLRHVLFHEYVHAMVHSITAEAPLWLNEGLAEYLAPRGLEKTGQAIPLRSLEDAFPMGDHRLTALAYMESYSAVSYLAGKHGLYSIKKLLLALSKGRDLDSAFREAFYVTYEEFVSTWGKG